MQKKLSEVNYSFSLFPTKIIWRMITNHSQQSILAAENSVNMNLLWKYFESIFFILINTFYVYKTYLNLILVGFLPLPSYSTYNFQSICDVRVLLVQNYYKGEISVFEIYGTDK